MKIAAYCRVSTDSGEQLESMKNQKIFFEDFARKNKFELIKIYADEGISGKQMKNRTQFLKMMQDARCGVFDMVVVKDISRFARNTVDFLNSVRELKSLGVEVKFLSNNQTILGDSEFILTIFSAMAQEESANLSKRVKFGKRINAARGRVPVRVYGYDRVDNFNLVPNEFEADVVRKIFNMYVYLGYGIGKIARKLTYDGVPTKLRANGWTPKTIRRILANPIYVGRLINNKYETTDYLTGKRGELPVERHICHERPQFRIVENDVFDVAQAKLDGRRRLYENEYVHRQGRESSRHMFSTLIKCEHCGYSFSRREYTYKNRRVYWLCSGFNVQGSGFCDNNTCVEERDLVRELKQYFNDLIKDKAKFCSRVADDFINSLGNNNFDVKKVNKQVRRLISEKKKWKDMYVGGVVDMGELKERTFELEEKISELQKSLLNHRRLIDNKEAAATVTDEIHAEIRRILTFEAFENADWKRIIDKIVVGKDGCVKIYLVSA